MHASETIRTDHRPSTTTPTTPTTKQTTETQEPFTSAKPLPNTDDKTEIPEDAVTTAAGETFDSSGGASGNLQNNIIECWEPSIF